MRIVGINGGIRPGYQDVSAALLIDGRVMGAVEEERLNRIKHCPGQLPWLAINTLLDQEGLTMRDVDVVASHGSTWGDDYVEILRAYFTHTFGHSPKIVRVHHHDAHAASAYFASGFDEAMILTMDSSGDGVSTQLAFGRGRDLKTLERISRPNSLGMFYSLITQYCGFARDRDEYKLMALASFGNPERYDFDWLLGSKDELFALNQTFLRKIKAGQSQLSRQEMMFTDELLARLGPKRLPGTPVDQRIKDIAASAQRRLEHAIANLVKRLHHQTGSRKLCIAGGVALNCVANGKLMELPFVDQIYVQPASSDAGVSLGAAYLAALELGDEPQCMTDAFLGPEFSNSEIERSFKAVNVTPKAVDDPADFAAAEVASGKVVGWFQGRMEFGPRALGNRSILASATDAHMKDLVNHKVKFRETFRPFCPSVLCGDAPTYFRGKQQESPFMNIAYLVEPDRIADIPAVVHVDGTARIQTVNKGLYHRFLELLKQKTGHGVCLNTSFNTGNQPIVCTPLEAISTFYGCGLDTLVIGNLAIQK